MKQPTTWIISDTNKVGTDSQCLGLAVGLGVDPVFKRIYPRFPWKYLPPALWFCPLSAPKKGGDSLTPPWPDLLIAGGRTAAAPAAKIRQKGGCFTIFMQNPYLPLSQFDLVIASFHEKKLKGPNVIPILGALHRLSPQKLKEEAQAWTPKLQDLPRPYTTVLIGGESAYYRYEEKDLIPLFSLLKKREEGSLLVTTSRRTRPEIISWIKSQLQGIPHHFYGWDGTEENPYLAFLGLADKIVATNDSVSMISEACFTGRPIYLFELPTSNKYHQFHKDLYVGDYARPLEEQDTSWTVRQLDEMQRILPMINTALTCR